MKIAKKCRERHIALHLPVDHVIGENFAENTKFGICSDKDG
jgi:hypothetical protein